MKYHIVFDEMKSNIAPILHLHQVGFPGFFCVPNLVLKMKVVNNLIQVPIL